MGLGSAGHSNGLMRHLRIGPLWRIVMSHDLGRFASEKVSAHPTDRAVFELDLVPVVVSCQDRHLTAGLDNDESLRIAARRRANDRLIVSSHGAVRANDGDAGKFVKKC